MCTGEWSFAATAGWILSWNKAEEKGLCVCAHMCGHWGGLFSFKRPLCPASLQTAQRWASLLTLIKNSSTARVTAPVASAVLRHCRGLGGLLTCWGAAVIAPAWGSGVGELPWLPLCRAPGELALPGSFTLAWGGSRVWSKQWFFLVGRWQAVPTPGFYKPKNYFGY